MLIIWSTRKVVPDQRPAGSGARHHLQRGVVADLGSGAERPRLQHVLHQAAVTADDVQRLHYKLLWLICWQAQRKSSCRNSKDVLPLCDCSQETWGKRTKRAGETEKIVQRTKFAPCFKKALNIPCKNKWNRVSQQGVFTLPHIGLYSCFIECLTFTLQLFQWNFKQYLWIERSTFGCCHYIIIKDQRFISLTIIVLFTKNTPTTLPKIIIITEFKEQKSIVKHRQLRSYSKMSK